MQIIDWANEGAKRFNNFIDLKLIVLMGVFLALIVVKLIPGVMNLSIWWFVGLFVIFGARPLYLFFIRH